MKKLILSVAVVAAMSFASCGTSTKQAEDEGEMLRTKIENCKNPDSLKLYVKQAKEYAGKIIIYKVNVDKQKELAALFNATSIPLFVFIPMKGEPQLFRGAADKATYKKAIDEFLLK